MPTGEGRNCPGCGATLPAGARACPDCGEAIASPSARERVADLQHRAQERLQQIDAKLEERLVASRALVGGAEDGAGLVSAETTDPHPRELLGLIKPEPSEPDQAAALVLQSAFVRDNTHYSDRADSTTFVYEPESGVVNAFATDEMLEMPGGEVLMPPLIILLGGMHVAVGLVAACFSAATLAREGMLLRRALRALGLRMAQDEGQLSPEAGADILRGCLAEAGMRVEADGFRRLISLAQSLRSSALMYVIGHELGHIALGHTLGSSMSYEVSRNQEREADSFVSSVLSTCPYREYHFVGQVAALALFAWVEHAAPSLVATSHPLARERLENALRTNSQAAREAETDFGLSRDVLDALLPQG